jgi:polyhydroxyalkanoate synthase
MQTLQRVLTTPYPGAQTPKETIWTLNKAKLYRYTPVVPDEQHHPVPLLLVFALMNRPTILDLRPGASFVEYMVHQGYDVYLLDWGAPGLEDQHLTLDDYVGEYLQRAIRKLKTTSGSQEFSMLGWCIGAILVTLYASVYPDEGLRNLLLLTAPLDFHDKACGGFIRWVNDKYFDAALILDAFGNMPGELLDYGAKALKPVDNFVTNYLRLWDRADDPKAVEAWHAMHTWVNDLIPLAGGTYRQLMVDLYQENRLMQGTMTLKGQRADPGRIRAAVLNVVATEDHIVPPCQSEGIMPKLGSQDKQLLKIAGGHIGMMAGSQAIKRAWPQIHGWLAPRSARSSQPSAATQSAAMHRTSGASGRRVRTQNAQNTQGARATRREKVAP